MPAVCSLLSPYPIKNDGRPSWALVLEYCPLKTVTRSQSITSQTKAETSQFWALTQPNVGLTGGLTPPEWFGSHKVFKL